MTAKKPSETYFLGVLLLLVTLGIYLFQLFYAGETRFRIDEGSPFFIVYGLNALYFIIIFCHHLIQRGFRGFHKGDEFSYSLALVMFSISAHTLNLSEDLNLFATYTNWMAFLVILMHVAVLIFPFRKSLPSFAQYFVYFICGISLVTSVYMTLFLGPINFIGLLLAPFLGISLVALVPFWFMIHFIQAIFRLEILPHSKRSYWMGVMAPVLILVGFLAKWQVVQSNIEKARENYKTYYADSYPEWVILSQKIPDGPFTEMVVMSEAISQKVFWDNNGRGLFNGSSYEEFVRHNPLAIMANELYGPLEFDNETLVKLLDSRFDARHMTHRRIWRGTHLKTTSINNNIIIYPEHRIAYIEKVMTIKNTNNGNRRGFQEAVYSFYLPEGSIATSLSLWVNGVEEKSRLTTRKKADNAYRRIVGVERRDPSLLHWQEGNRVTVTIYPCTPAEERKFKVGFTVPMTLDGGDLVLENVYFKGPTSTSSREETHLTIAGELTGKPDLFWGMRRQGQNKYHFRGHYSPDRVMKFPAPPLAEAPFSFNGKSFKLIPNRTINRHIDLEEVILDINRKWTQREYNYIRELFAHKKIYAFTPEKVQITDENQKAVFAKLRENHFTLLPLYKLADPAHALVVSHSTPVGPILKDLDHSLFAAKLSNFLKQTPEKIKWFDLGDEPSPIVRSLKECRILDYQKGNLKDLDKVISSKVFIAEYEPANEIAIAHAGMNIQYTEGTTSSSAPDHLMRLYAYNNLMKTIGRDYFDREKLEDEWLRGAEESFIVSPVSSLIVLETIQDYNRFDIKENTNTLGNASKSNSGSVPEPHEWVLIVLVGLMVVWQGRRWI